ncbi:MAG: efflux transporter outer membrane subunit [Bordetella sp.]|uniref:efflux transporter outer membrane subunit n=1 Tax=Bordetella sp. TaxID=28081 RepID=UPI003F7C3365
MHEKPHTPARRLAGWLKPASVSSLVLAWLLTGCTVGPDYRRPTIALPDHYRSAEATATRRADLARWWNSFDDPGLSRLMEHALAGNLDLAAAQARVAQARAAAGMAAAAAMPRLDLDGSAAREHQSELGPLGAIASRSPGYARDQTLQQLNLGASWELDLAGGLKRRTEAMRALWQAAQAEHAGVRISIAAETADAYFQLRSDQQAQALLQSQIDLDRQYVQVMRDRVGQGVATDRDVDDARAQLAQDQALLPALRTQLVRQADRLDILGGDVPGTDPQRLRVPAGPSWRLPPLPGELHPAQLLQRRPDVIAAERRLAARNAGIGAAQAQYYPDISLAGILGFERLGNDNLFNSEAFQPAALAGIHWSLFDFGRIDAEVAQAKGAYAEALAQYRQAVLRATQDTEDALTTLAQSHIRMQDWEAVVAARERADQSTHRLFTEGSASMADVLSRERDTLQARRALVLARGDAARAAVDLYRALGGGWTVAGPSSPAA